MTRIMKKGSLNQTDKNKNLGSYIASCGAIGAARCIAPAEQGDAGLIEGDGAIHIPKNIKSASIITISFHSKDLPSRA